MTGVALLDRSFDQASAPESCGESRLPATSVAQKSCHHELFGLTAISTLINASAAASQMTCSINEKHYCEAGSECRRIENTMSARIDLDRKL
jgi:hypothetical protein